MRKKDLEFILETIPSFPRPKVYLEQYVTPSDIASDIIWYAYMSSDLVDSIVVDLGAGTGRLGLGAAILEAKYVILIDVDEESLKVALSWSKENKLANVDFIISDVRSMPIREIATKVLVIQNPPFGIRSRVSDVDFLKSAFNIALVVYSLHRKHEKSRQFLKSVALNFGFNAKLIKTYQFRIPQIYEDHYRRAYYIEVDLWRFERRGYDKKQG